MSTAVLIGLAALLFGAGVASAAPGITGTVRITDGPGVGRTFTATNGSVNNNGFVGVIEEHGGNCTGPHFHGTFNGAPDPNPTSCGWGHVMAITSSGVTSSQHIGETANPRGGAAPTGAGQRIARGLLLADASGAALPALTVPLIADIAAVTGSSLTGVPLQVAIKERLDGIFTKFKGTGDIAGVAQALLDFNEWHKQQTGSGYYEWAGESDKIYTDTPDKTSTDLEKFKLTTQLACYEFVEFCGYIASDQITKPRVLEGEEQDDNGNIIKPAVYDPNVRYVFWGFPVPEEDYTKNLTTTDVRDNPGSVQSGQIVIGIGRWSNNKSGYNHVAISVGNGEVISLGSGGLKKEALGGKLSGCFWSLGYNNVLAGDFKYSGNNPAPVNPTVPIK